MSCITYNCEELPDYADGGCAPLLDGYSQAILLECGHTITDPSNATQINANLASGKAKLYPGLKVGVPARSPLSVAATVSGETDTVVNYDNTASWVDGNVNLTNDEHYSVLFGGHKFAGAILYNGLDEDSPRILFINATMKATGGLISGDNGSESERYEGTFSWRSKQLPKHYPAPAGVFD